MRKIMYRLVFNRKNRLNTKGEGLIQIEAYCRGVRKYFSTHTYVKPTQWDKRHQKIKRHPNKDVLNMMLMEKIIEIERIEFELWKQNETEPLAALKRIYDGSNNSSNGNFYIFMTEAIESSDIKENTRLNRKTTLSLLKNFRRNIKFNEINVRFVEDFSAFMNSMKLSKNTIAKHLSHLKIYVRKAIDTGILDEKRNPFNTYKIKREECKHTFLTPQELNLLENAVLKTKKVNLQKILDAFLFCCYTGLRFSDFVKLSPNNIEYDGTYHWLSFKTVKTGIDIKMPLTLLFEGKVLKIMEKYKQNPESFFRIPDNQTVDKHLISIGKMAHLRKHISFHTARHTSATLLLFKGVNVTTVQKILGHKDLKTTMGYCDVMNQTIVSDLTTAYSR